MRRRHSTFDVLPHGKIDGHDITWRRLSGEGRDVHQLMIIAVHREIAALPCGIVQDLLRGQMHDPIERNSKYIY